MGQWRHVLSEIDPSSRRANCRACGSVDIIPACRQRDPARDWRCKTGRQQTRTKDRRLSKGKRTHYTEAQYEEFLAQQQGGCAICGTQNAVLFLDHDHETGVLRGLLCRRCNFGLGWFQDDIAFLRAAIDYLSLERTA